MKPIHSLLLSLALTGSFAGLAGAAPWSDLPAAAWQGLTNAEVPALKRSGAAAVAWPAREAKPLVIKGASPLGAGLYELQLTLRASHSAGAIAYNSGLRLKVKGKQVAEIPGEFFARPHEAETRTLTFVHPGNEPLEVTLEAYTDNAINVAARSGAKPLPAVPGEDKGQDGPAGFALTPEAAVYYLVDAAQVRALSASGMVHGLDVDKIRYRPGDTIRGQVSVTDVGGKGGSGTVTLFLETGLAQRTKIKTLPVTLGSTAVRVPFEIPLGKEELGHAVVAQYSNAAGTDKSETAEYITVAANFNRVAIFGGSPGGTRDVTLDEEPIRKALSASRANYYNAVEYPFWAEDDLLAMSPQTDYWFSGQSNYHMNKGTLQRQIKLAKEQGIAMVTYGKWCVSGPSGWETVYDRPRDYQGSYNHPIAMWGSVNGGTFDLRRNGEQVPYSPRPGGQGPWFDVWWSEFLGITPDSTAANVRRAAEETLRSIQMFGWDGIRWDGHPQGAGWAQVGRAGNYQPWAARQTQTMVRYFKDLVEAKSPGFGHGYNYLLVDPKKDHSWAIEDFEIDELARGGGLIMNESIGNASGGWTFKSIVENLQVDGDLCRERGGYYLGISFAHSKRDQIIESALWAAAGCRPYNSGMTREVRRYCTRYGNYTFDERLRRLATPEKVLAPAAATPLWWQPFVYETPLQNGKRQLVVNLLNIPQEAKRPPRSGNNKPEWTMPEGTAPVSFGLTLPQGIKATAASLINPQTLEVSALKLAANKLEVPAVASWSVAIIDLEVAPGAPSLGELYGPMKTVGVLRKDLPAEERKPEVILETSLTPAQAEAKFAALAPVWDIKGREEQALLDAMDATQLRTALQKKRSEQSEEEINKQWWKGGALPQDIALRDKIPNFGDLTPERNGRFDILYARGAMDYRLKMPLAIAGLPRTRVQDAPYWGGFRGGAGGMGVSGGMPWNRYPKFDMLLLTGIPHAAIGAENAYGMVEYVKAGGSAFITGGEYGFGKGGYIFTVLERELLPVLCTQMKDSRTSPTPIAMVPGKDFAELKSKAGFTTKPSFWVYNQVILKDNPNIKVFLTSEKGPVLVGWQVGKGRVACLLADYRGKSENGTTAFFDWADWPELARSVMNWLAPEAGRNTPAPAVLTAAAAEDEEVPRTKDPLGGIGLPGPADPSSPGEKDPAGRLYYNALALTQLKTPERVEEGRKLVAQWNDAEKEVMDKWTGGKGFSVAAPELPCLNAEILLQRSAWLAYLSRHDAKTFGAQFTREWLKTRLYQDYANRSQGNRRAGDWKRIGACFGRLGELARPDVEALLKSHPDVAAEGLAQARFTREYNAARDLLGGQDRAATQKILTRLRTARHPDLAAFATARLAAPAQ